jgi:hypothetical protein
VELDETNRNQLREVKDIAYESDLSSYNRGGNDYYEPVAPAGYVFE